MKRIVLASGFLGLALACGGSSLPSTSSSTGSSGSQSSAGTGSTGRSTTGSTASGSSGSATGSTLGSGSSGSASSGSASGSGSGSTSASTTGSTTGSTGSGCRNNADCGGGRICDVDYATCCPAMTGTDFYVDGVTPFEAACCGGSTQDPCGNLAHAMDLLNAAGISGATLHGYNSDSSPDWVPALGTVIERWPIHLGLGVTLSAPGVYFAPPAKGDTVFLVAPYSAADRGRVTLEGTAAAPLQIGNAFSGQNGQNARIGVEDGHLPDGGAGLPLTLSGVAVGASAVGIDLAGGATATLGPDPVSVNLSQEFGFDQLQFVSVLGPIGIACQGTGTALTDVASPAGDGGVLTVTSTGTQVYVGEGCQASLTAGPSLGLGENFQGSVFCSSQVGVRVSGNSQLTFGSLARPGLLFCANQTDLDMEATASGAPTVSLGGAFVGHACVGAYVNAGRLTAVASQFETDHYGVVVNGAASAVSLAGDGGAALANTLACNAYNQQNSCNLNGYSSLTTTAFNLLNLTTAVSVDARNAIWDHWSGGQTEAWTCDDATLASCSCSGPNCPPTNVPVDLTSQNNSVGLADAISLATFSGSGPAIDSANGSPNRVMPCPQ